MVSYETEHPMEPAVLLEFCANQLSPADYLVLCSASYGALDKEVSGSEVLEKWRNWEKTLRNELVKLRAAERGVNADAFLKETKSFHALADIAKAAYQEDSPLQSEEILNRARWSYLDELEVGHFFDLEKLVIYYVRLQLLERKRTLNHASGIARYEGIYKTITAGLSI